MDLGGCGLGGSVKDKGDDLNGGGSKTDDDVGCSFPASGHRKHGRVRGELSVIPGLAIVMAIEFVELVEFVVFVEDIDLSSISGDGTGAGAVGGDLGPLVEGWTVNQGDGEGEGERGRDAKRKRLLLVVKVGALAPDAVHITATIEGDAVMVVRLAAGVKPRPG